MDPPRYRHPATITALLEVIASERPDTLPATIEILQNSIACRALDRVAKGWGIREPAARAPAERIHEGVDEAAAELVTALKVASAKLNGLERRSGRWDVDRHGSVSGGGLPVSIPNVGAVLDLAAARSGRVSDSRAAALAAIMRKLEAAVESERTGRMIADFMSEPL